MKRKIAEQWITALRVANIVRAATACALPTTNFASLVFCVIYMQ